MKQALAVLFALLFVLSAQAQDLPDLAWQTAKGWKVAHTEPGKDKFRATIERDSLAGWATIKIVAYRSKNNDFIKEAGRILDEGQPLAGLRVYRNAGVKDQGVFFVEFIGPESRGCIVGKHLGELLILAIGEWPAGTPHSYNLDAIQMVRSVGLSHGG